MSTHLTSRTAAAIDARRDSIGMSRRTLADVTDIPRATLDRRLTGRSPLKVGELAAIASALGCAASDLIAEAEAAGDES